MGQGVGNLEHVAGYVLKEVHAGMRAEMDAALRALGLTVPQYACLEVLGQRSPLSSAALARASFVSRQSMHVMLTAMSGSGWVRPSSVGAPGRARPYELTERGRTILTPASIAVRQVEDRMLHHLDHDQQEQLLTLLRACIRGLHETSPGPLPHSSRTGPPTT